MTREELQAIKAKMDYYESDKRLRCAIETLIPELRESEDERIRKAIVHLLEVASEAYLIEATGFKKEQFLSYLEKKKEQKPDIEICPHSIESKSYKENGYPIEDCDYGLEIALNILEKTLGKVQGFQTDDGVREHQTAIKAVKDAMKEQKPAEWSEEDKNRHLYLCNLLRETWYKVDKGSCIDDAITWLEELPKRIFPHSWKQSDEQMLKGAVEGIIHAFGLHNSIYINDPEWDEKLDKYKDGDKVLVIVLPKEDRASSNRNINL